MRYNISVILEVTMCLKKIKRRLDKKNRTKAIKQNKKNKKSEIYNDILAQNMVDQKSQEQSIIESKYAAWISSLDDD